MAQKVGGAPSIASCMRSSKAIRSIEVFHGFAEGVEADVESGSGVRWVLAAASHISQCRMTDVYKATVAHDDLRFSFNRHTVTPMFPQISFCRGKDHL